MTGASLKDWDSVSKELTRLGVEAELTGVKPVGASLDDLKALKQAGEPLMTPGLLALQQSPDVVLQHRDLRAQMADRK